MVFIKLVLSLYFVQVKASSEVPKLMTKQALTNIRYISSDGKYTYYQRPSGSLILSTNYKIFEIIKGKPNSQYTIIGAKDSENILISQNEFYFQEFSSRTPTNIYWKIKGSEKVHFLGTGRDPKIHLQGNWASLYSPLTNLLKFYDLKDQNNDFEIKLMNTQGKYFSPQVVMLKNKKVLYTDINKKGITGLVQYNLITKKSKLIQKVDSPLLKLEICLLNDSLITGQFGLSSTLKYSQITQTKLYEKNFPATIKELYQKNNNDPGQLICDNESNNIFFIKDTSSEDRKYSEVAAFNTTRNQLQIMSSMKYITQIFSMDGMILVPHNKDIYVIKGNNKIGNNDRLIEK